MTITVNATTKEFQDLKGSEGKEPRKFIILKENQNSGVGDTVIVQEVDDKEQHTGQELQFEITYVLGDPIHFKKGWRSVGIKPKA